MLGLSDSSSFIRPPRAMRNRPTEHPALLVSCGFHGNLRRHRMRLASVLILLLSVGAVAQNQPAPSGPAFEGTYEQLKPQQKRLIDEWYEDYNKMMHEDLPPSDYNQ